ncbi:unnamed protein product [Rotaria sordida]|uniref:J domain-containing protein n=1 Tax=Rotaria sordida TaxID=392033 RepID=A0A814S0Y4_9BILA|nr:unnamed protein product [Rotaria sordida]
MASQPSNDKRNDASSTRPPPAGTNSDSQARKRLFSKELRNMMYGFGDDPQPYAESVELLEDLVIQYITDMTLKATEIGSNKQGRIVVNDILFNMNLYIYVIIFQNLFIINVHSLIDGLYCGKENCYDLLNVTRAANKQEIIKAYRGLAKKYHPDMAKTLTDKEIYTEKFRAFANAYEILKDEETRADYDRMLDNPDQYYTHYYRYYRHRYAPKVDVRLVIFILISVISAIQYYSQYSNYNTAINYLVTVPKYRIQAQEIARQEGLIGNNSESSKKNRGRKIMSKQEEEAILKQIVERNLDIKGGYKKPSITRVLWLQLVLFPYYLFLKLQWHIRWFYKFNINKHELGEDEKIYLVCRNLKMNREQYESLSEKEHNQIWERQIWIKENFRQWKLEKEVEQKKKLNESGRYKAYRRYIKSGGPGQITFDPD